MNIQTVTNNLRATIAGKEQHLKTLGSDLLCGDYVDRTATVTTIEILKINITELKRILQDVEQCIEKDVEQSWRDNPDRSGGQFTQDEIDNAGAWR
jgi:hypothetical protein